MLFTPQIEVRLIVHNGCYDFISHSKEAIYLKEIFSFVFDMLTDPLTLPVEPWKEWAILVVIGFIAYRIAFDMVGGMYALDLINSRFAGSLAHWTIRDWSLCLYGLLLTG